MPPTRKPPRSRDDSIVDLLNSLSERPAMNGGFAKLAAQQDEQCTRLENVEAWTKTWDSRLKALRTLGFAVLVGIVVTLAKDWIERFPGVLH